MSAVSYELTVSNGHMCPVAKKKHRHGDQANTKRYTLRVKGGKNLRYWFDCPECTPQDLIIPDTAREAYEIYQQFGRYANAFRQQDDRRIISEFTTSA
jgi:hypothetical protein